MNRVGASGTLLGLGDHSHAVGAHSDLLHHVGASQEISSCPGQPHRCRLAAAVVRTLVETPDVPAMDIHVSAQDGVVVLRGHVPSRAAASRAVTVARGVPGVRAVRDMLATGE